MTETSIFVGQKDRVIDYLVQNNPGYSVISVAKLENQIKSYSRFFDDNKIFLIENPNNDQIKIIGSLNNNQYQMFFEDESYDGRNSFVSKLKKENKIFDFSHPIAGDTIQLKRIVSTYFKLRNISLDNQVFDWICVNCPTYKIKSKESNKEKTVYDLDLLYREIDKISSCKNQLSLEDFKDSYFKTDQDLFHFFEKLLDKDEEYVFSHYEYFLSELGEQALLLIFLSQIIFLLNFKTCKDKNIWDLQTLQNKIEMKDLVNKYLSDNWTEINAVAKSVNPIRVKIQLNKQTPSVNVLSQIFQYIVEALLRLRNHGNKDLEVFNLICKTLSV